MPAVCGGESSKIVFNRYSALIRHQNHPNGNYPHGNYWLINIPKRLFGVDDAVLFHTRLPGGIALYEVAEVIAFSMPMPALCEELQLNRPVPLFGWTALSYGYITHLLCELDDKG